MVTTTTLRLCGLALKNAITELSQSFDSLNERDELAINCEETYNYEKTTMNSNNSKHIAIQLEAKQLRRMAAQHTV